MKKCKGCGELKSLEKFSLHKGFKDGRNSKCKLCKASMQSEGYKSGKYIKTQWTYEKQLKYKYGISKVEFDTMLTSQDNKCKICLEELTKPNVDHCHKTNKVRGLLCTRCNTGLGKFADDPERLKKAIEYLED